VDYPHSPPTLSYYTNGDGIRFHPNLYKRGKVCISILNTWRGEPWSSCQTITSVLLTLCSLLTNEPLLNEPGVSKTHSDFNKYTKIIEYKNVEIACLHMLSRKEGIFQDKFYMFYPYMREEFIKNKKRIEEFLEKKMKISSDEEVITTGIYSMNVSINYKSLMELYKQHVAIMS
jgi:ubiquitin-conjugating enzyme E2 Z